MTVKELVTNTSQHHSTSESTLFYTACVVDMNTLTKQLTELRNLEDDSELMRSSIALMETALRKAQAKCMDILNRDS